MYERNDDGKSVPLGKKSLLSRQLCEEMETLLKNAYAGADASMTVRQADREEAAGASPETAEAVRGAKAWKGAAAAGAVLPGAACALGLLLKASPLLTGAITLACCAGELFALHRALELNAKPVEKVSVPPARLALDEEARGRAWSRSREEMQRILEFVDRHEAERDRGYDVTMDRRFGEWVQSFLKNTRDCEDRALARMRDNLLDRLELMKINVYDELKFNAAGKPDVPFEDYLIDAREGERYTELVQPAIYSDRCLLARGKVK